VCCDGTDGEDRTILAVYSGTTHYGVLDIYDQDTGTVTFCCEGTADLGTTSAVYVIIDAGDRDDMICLHDSTENSCEDNITGVQSWEAGAYVDGGEGADTISTCPTSAEDDEIEAGNANDIVYTFGSSDTICAGPGADDVDAGDDADTIYGEAGADRDIYGGSGGDTIVGGDGEDHLNGDNGIDCLCAGPANGTSADGYADTLVGGVGDDDCYYDETADGDTASTCGGTEDNAATKCGCYS